MNPRIFFNPTLASVLLLALAACGGPAQDAPPPVPASQPQDQAPAEAADGVDGGAGAEPLRAPSRPTGDARQQRGIDDEQGAGSGFAEGHPVPDEARALMGEWVVAGHRFGAASAMDDAAAMRLHGREVSYGDAHANSGADSCGAPRYAVEQRNVIELLLADYRTSPSALGLDQATDAQVTVIDVECAMPWVTLGSRVLVLPEGPLLAPWDGVFFELRPR